MARYWAPLALPRARRLGLTARRRGQRSYYPLFCTVAQTGQVLDVLHRSGNVHDSQGAKQFILHCISAVRAALPGVAIEVRMDSAFFSDEIIGSLDAQGVEYTVLSLIHISEPTRPY